MGYTGDLKLQQSLTSNQTVGGVSSGTTFNEGSSLETLIRTILITFIRSTLSTVRLKDDGSDVSTSTREVNSSIPTDQFRVTTTANSPNSLTPVNLTITGSGATTGNFTEDFTGTTLSAGTNTISFASDKTLNITTIPTANSQNITIEARAFDATDSVELDTTRTYTYVYPMYSNVSSTDLSSASGTDIESDGATKITATKSNRTISVNPSSEFIQFAYPKRYGNLSSILDGNGFENLTNFTQHEVTINGGNGWTGIEYYLYQSNSTTTINPAQNFQFKF